MIFMPSVDLRRKRVVINVFLSVALVLMVAAGARARAAQAIQNDSGQLPQGPVREWWGRITAPVFDRLETSPGYKDEHADMFAGPDKFAADKGDSSCYQNYFCGVLPNGRIVKPAGRSAQIGMNPLGAVLTPDGKYLITSNDDEREEDPKPLQSYKDEKNLGGYSLSVINATTLEIVSHLSIGKLFIGLQVTGTGPYTVWVSGGGDNDVKIVTISKDGSKQGPVRHIPILPITPAGQGFVSRYSLTTFPAGSALSPDRRFLYVACNGDNSLAVIDTTKAPEKPTDSPKDAVVAQIAVGYFPYTVAVSPDGRKVAVSNWGITQYKFAGAGSTLMDIDPIRGNKPDGFYVPPTDTEGLNPKTSSVSIVDVPNGDGSKITLSRSIYLGHMLDDKENVGDTHPSAMAILSQNNGKQFLYVAKSNSDKLAVIDLKSTDSKSKEPLPQSKEIPLFPFSLKNGEELRGAYPNAIAISKDGARVYVAEAGINSVAVLDPAKDPLSPVLLGRIPTGWYPTALAVGGTAAGELLYVANAKGIGEDINRQIKLGLPATDDAATPTGLASDPNVDSNFVFGTVQQIATRGLDLSEGERLVRAYSFSIPSQPPDASIIPVGGKPSRKITHVFFILHENKTFDSMLGNRSDHFRGFAGTVFNGREGSPYRNLQYTGVSLNTQRFATRFATAVNYYSDSEESDAGHQFAASGTASDYTEKTLLVKNDRGLLVNKNFEPEDYPEHGYIFNNAARNGVSFKDYGDMVRIAGTDTGQSTPTILNDPGSGNLGYPGIDCGRITAYPQPFQNCRPSKALGDVTSPVSGFGQSYYLKMPVLAILGTANPSGEDRLDHNYPGYNFNISDQRRAQEFIKDFDRMVKNGTLPQFLYIYQPNDHTGSVQAPNKGNAPEDTRPQQQVADGDVALGMVVEHIMKSKVYYDDQTGEGSAIFITWDDAQSTLDHIHPHRTPLIVVSPYAKPGYIARRHYSTASIVKTEELLLGLPPNNLGDLLTTDLRDMFTDQYNGITAGNLSFTRSVVAEGSPEGKRIWALASRLDTSAPDHDTFRLGALARLSMEADDLRKSALSQHHLRSAAYHAKQARLYEQAVRLVSGPARRDDDD